MKHITSRLLALLLTVAMIVSIVPAVYAADEDVTIVENEQPTVEETIVENSTEDTTVEPAKAAEANLSEGTTEGTTTDVAEVGGTSYTTLAGAIAAAVDGGTVTLLDNVTEDVTINTDITLDLGGKTLTNTNAGKATLTVAAGATATVKNGSIVGGTGHYNIAVGTKAVPGGNLTLEGVTATAGNTGSSMIDNYGDLTINSGSYTGGLDTIKNESNAKLTITGGTFTLEKGTSKGFTGVVFNYGELNISGGEFIQNDPER